MQRDINQAIFTARLTEDPEPGTTPDGTAVATLRVAIQRRPGRDGTDRGAAFYDLEVWNGLADTCVTYLAKGRRIAVEARMEHDEWTGEDGRRRERNYLVAEDVQFLDGPPPRGADGARPETEPAAA